MPTPPPDDSERKAVLDALQMAALSGNVKAIEMWLQMQREQPAGGGDSGGEPGGLLEPGDPPVAAGWATIRAEREHYQAQMARIELEQRQGKLLDAEEVRASIALNVRRAAAILDAIPGRLARLVLGLTDEDEIRALMDREIRRARVELARMDTAGPIEGAGQ